MIIYTVYKCRTDTDNDYFPATMINRKGVSKHILAELKRRIPRNGNSYEH